ncbi:MAG: hypothetical protein WCG06_06580, partial [Candidatus Omnitrophota bacterium]
MTLDLHMHLTYDLRTKRYTLDGYFVQPGNTGANVARSQSSGKTPSVFVGVSSGFEQRVLLRKLASTLGRVQAKIAKGQGRVSMYWHIPSQASAGIASVYAFTPAQPVLTAEQGDELLARLQRLPVSVDKQFFVVSGRVFSGLDGGYYLRAFKILRVKGYRIAADIKQYQTSDEIRLIAAAGPDLLLLNTRELATLYNASRSGPMRYQAEQTAQRAYDVAKENNIPMVVVSLEEKGAVAIFPSDTSHGSSYQAWRATLAPLSANGDWEAADDALLAGLIHELSLRPEQYLPAMRRALAARAVNAIFSGPVTVRVTDTRVEPLLEQVQFKQIALVFQKGLTNAARLAQRKPIGTPRVMAVETLDGRRLMAGGAAATSAGEIAKNLSVGGALVGQGQIPQTEALKDAADALAAAHQANVPKVQTLAEGEATAQEFKTMVSQLQTRVAGGQELITYQKTAVPALLHSLTGVDFTQPISDADMTAIQNGPAGQVSAKFFYDDSGA